MADVQIDNGNYTRIANESLIAVASFEFNAAQLSIIMILWRQTYGWKCSKETKLSTSFIAKATGFSNKQIQRALTDLIKSNVVKVISEQHDVTPRVLGYNKNYDTWVKEKRGVTKKTPPIKETPPLLGNPTPPLNVPPTPPLLGNQRKKVLNKVLKKDEPDNFSEKVWSSYPKKEGTKSKVLLTIKKLAKKYGEDHIERMVSRYVEKIRVNNTGKQFILMASTFFNGRCEDYSDENYNDNDNQQGPNGVEDSGPIRCKREEFM